MRCLRVCIFSSTAFRLGTLVSCFCTFLRSFPGLFRPAFPALAAAVRGAVGSDLSSLPSFLHPSASFHHTSTTSFSLSSNLFLLSFSLFLLLLACVASHASVVALPFLVLSLSTPRWPSHPKRGAFASVLPTKESSKHLPPLSTSQTNWDGWIRTNHTRLSPSLSPSDTHTHTHTLSDTHEQALARTTTMADGGWRGRFTVGCVARPRGCGGRCTARRGEGVARVDPRTRETKVRLPRTPSS